MTSGGRGALLKAVDRSADFWTVRRTSPIRCPQCRERVSRYAAGCALCGADLDPDRTRHVPLSRRIGSAWDAFSVRTELIVLALVVILVVSYLGAGRL